MATAEGDSPALSGAKSNIQGSNNDSALRSIPGATPTFNVQGKRPFNNGKSKSSKKKRPKRERLITEGSTEEVLAADIRDFLASRLGAVTLEGSSEGRTTNESQQDAHEAHDPLPEPGSEIEVEVFELSSTGDGLALQHKSSSPRVYVVPFVVPGDVARVKVFRHLSDEPHSIADFLSIVTPSPLRDDSRIRCRYFSTCSGCQFQMLDYTEQLRLKQRIVERAYLHFANLPPEEVPSVLPTIGSPLQYGYRTKLTPHFDGPPGFQRRRGPKQALDKCPDIGFMKKGQRKVIDIEDCPIGTEAVRLGLKSERQRMGREFGNYSKGATILLRETTTRYKKGEGPIPDATPEGAVRIETEEAVDIKTCQTDSNALTTEYVDSFLFTNPAGSFFQNNNSILSPFTAYVREHILPPPPQSTSSINPTVPDKNIKYLIDAYSGSGLFTITLSSLFESSVGIDVAENSIRSARQNAQLSGIPESRARFVAADARRLFEGQDLAGYDPDETVVVLDPPRKGCDADFLGQLLKFAPKRVVYVSCNVHTQARDVGVLVRGLDGIKKPMDEGAAEEVEEGASGTGGKPDAAEDGVHRGEPLEGASQQNGVASLGTRYKIESLRGFDFFPQTGHVEGVAVLNRVD